MKIIRRYLLHSSNLGGGSQSKISQRCFKTVMSRKIQFRELVLEAAIVYPKARKWTARILCGREAHHGYSHAQEVRAMSRTIAIAEGVLSRGAYPLMYLVALTHDIDDKKVDPDGEYKRSMHRFLMTTVSPQLGDFIINAVERISMSYETVNGSTNWINVLGASGLLIRHYVSDADKMLCLGAEGHKRIVEYNVSKILLQEHIHSEAQVYSEFSNRLLQNVSEVMQVRMQYVPNYLRTPYAKSRAVTLMRELECAHDAWKQSVYRRQC